tara:strand:+ start:2708 stop:3628 length:921 start_codon:yes stop_codon:yes gene_type:complete
MARLPNMHLLDLSHRGAPVGMAGKGRASPAQSMSDEGYLAEVASKKANQLQDMPKMQTYVATLNEMAFRKPDMRARILPVVQGVEGRMFVFLKNDVLGYIDAVRLLLALDEHEEGIDYAHLLGRLEHSVRMLKRFDQDTEKMPLVRGQVVRDAAGSTRFVRPHSPPTTHERVEIYIDEAEDKLLQVAAAWNRHASKEMHRWELQLESVEQAEGREALIKAVDELQQLKATEEAITETLRRATVAQNYVLLGCKCEALEDATAHLLNTIQEEHEARQEKLDEVSRTLLFRMEQVASRHEYHQQRQNL